MAKSAAAASRRADAGEQLHHRLPAVDRLAADPLLIAWQAPAAARAAARIVLSEARSAVTARHSAPPAWDVLVGRVDALMRSWLRSGPVRVLNATGVVLHTNLGRAPLSQAAQAALTEAAGYCAVEYDLETGRRSSRQEHLRPLLRLVSGAADGLAVTNNAAALFLVLRALCYRREVLVSRGEAVAIGDGFRIPTIMAASGARLVDVGTTNRTTAGDFEEAITSRTAAILRVHPSNFSLAGFTERPDIEACAALARSRSLLLIDDVGSGWLEPHPVARRTDTEPVIRDVVQAGADVITCSADKLCGGPQAGLIFTQPAIAEKLRRHPVARVVRPDKLIVAALAATLTSYIRGAAHEELPVLRMLDMSPSEIERRALVWCKELREQGLPAAVCGDTSAVGGGALPSTRLPTHCLALPDRRGLLNRALASQQQAIVARVARGRVLLDPRTIDPDDDQILIEGVLAAWRAQAP